LLIYNLAGDKTGDQAEDNPAEDRHLGVPLSLLDPKMVSSYRPRRLGITLIV
jgi:hypothetical protein